MTDITSFLAASSPRLGWQRGGRPALCRALDRAAAAAERSTGERPGIRARDQQRAAGATGL